MNICLGLIRFHKKNPLIYTKSSILHLQACCFLSVYNVSFPSQEIVFMTNESLEHHTAHHFYLSKRQCCSLTWQWFAFEYRGKQIHIAVLSFTMVWFGLFVYFYWCLCRSVWTVNETQWYRKQLWHRAECVFASELQFHGLLAPF